MTPKQKHEQITKLLEGTNLIYGKFRGSKSYGLAYWDKNNSHFVSSWTEYTVATNLDMFIMILNSIDLRGEEEHLKQSAKN
ncbi:TPA: hypothetical protein ACK3Q6_002615 [Burkholderia cepacia]|uniref:hypothetical protein n=1 Tax=Burkholderia cepacia TaxID=292 RepID=UPI001CF11695|nr:hypothetical protein [Burkholderia cepacia]HDR9764246.1 hypothetical protein [Burkholderia cepacia ATCC 25416]MCA8361276.1 hypothetical protein [Burkholderia cepacia]HDR9771340.1 hypothetical protein [Burkholderia cepacia ATCC 25416]HDR9780054.1 hypothetical protein [Burkholderia cepacia ATCC 25416]HDR9787342.1 hypothetical protein [Burkholderia cepacia ATCC 25416]